jgi:hypothetical protein
MNKKVFMHINGTRKDRQIARNTPIKSCDYPRTKEKEEQTYIYIYLI